MQRYASLLVGAMLALIAASFLPAVVIAQMSSLPQERQPYEDEVCVLLPEINGEPTRLVGLSLHVTGKDVALTPDTADRMVSVQCSPMAAEKVVELEQIRVDLEAHIAVLEEVRALREIEIAKLEAVKAVLEEEIAVLEAIRQEYLSACATTQAACEAACHETQTCIELCDCVGDGCDCGCGIPNCHCPTCVVEW